MKFVTEPLDFATTHIRYYTLAAPTTDTTSPTLVYQGTFSTSEGGLWYWMSSNAIDSNENVVYTFTGGNSGEFNYPSPYMDRIDKNNNPGTPTKTASGEGFITYGWANADNYAWWEEATSVAIAPDGVTFWATGEWLSSNESSCCNWQTQVFACQEGQTGGFCP
jgi:hypothetical protein